MYPLQGSTGQYPDSLKLLDTDVHLIGVVRAMAIMPKLST